LSQEGQNQADQKSENLSQKQKTKDKFLSIENMKKQPIKWEKIFINHTFDFQNISLLTRLINSTRKRAEDF
jgi:hypothetical protein